jgi:hypothetical protein
MAKEISVHGRKHLSTLQKEFSEKFPHLILGFIHSGDRGKSVNVRGLDTSKSISATRTKTSNEEVSLHGRTKVSTMEEKFWEELGIAVQIAVQNYAGKKFYFPIGDGFNEQSLTKANAWAESKGCTKVEDIDAISGRNIF